MPTTLSPVDLAIVAAYIAAMTVMGAWFTRQQKNLKAYFVGGRDVGWFMVLVSIVATETSAVTFLSVPGLAYDPKAGNLTFLQLALGYIVGRCLVAWLLLPLYMRGELFSAYQVLNERFGPAVQRVASGLFLVTRTVADGLRLYLTALVMQYVGVGVEAAIVGVGAVTIVYTFLGGMKAVLWTDLIQFAIKIAGAALAFGLILHQLPGGWDQFVAQGSAAGKFRVFDFAWNPSSDAVFWAGLFGGAVFSMASHGADQLMVQRYLCARSLTHARVALVLSGVTVAVQFLLFLCVGVGMYLLREAGLFPEAFEATRNDEVFGLYIVNKMPDGVAGVLVAAILAAAMSTLSSSLNSSANALVTDFYRPLRPGHPEGWYVLLSRCLTVFWGLAQTAVAVVAYRSGGGVAVVKQVLAIAGLTTGLILGLFLLGRMRRPVSSSAAIAGLVCGAAVVGAVYINSSLAFPWYAPVGAGVTVGVALLASPLGRHGPAPAPPDRSPEPGVRPAG